MQFQSLSALAVAALAGTASASWAISGATSGIDKSTGARPFRLPISELQQSGPMWDLYIQAVQYWQTLDQSGQFSWYQVAGIHGLPNVPWDDATSAAGPDGYYVGYCKHQSILFPVWHRSYMALYEQIISIYAHEIAATYPQDQLDKYTQAADQLRMPYWDWTTDAKIPDAMAQQQLTINAAWGSQQVDNPLYRYNFHPYTASAMDNIYSDYNWTIRAPDGGAKETADQQLLANQQQFHDGAYTLFSSQPNYTLFSNTAANGDKGGYQNIENIHNIVHTSVGGDMAYLWVAAQDPIFFLHHANVDRLFAIWQAIYPDSWVTPQANSVGSYTTSPGTIEDQNTPLEPFHKDDHGDFFTADNIRDIKTFGYAYREIVDWNVTKEQLTSNAKAAVNQIYNPNGSGATSKKRNDKRTEVTRKSATAADNQYVLNIVVDKSKINGSMSMNFSINNQTVGSYPILMGGKTQMDRSNIAKASGQMALTHALLSTGCNLNDRNGTLDTIAKGMSWTGVTIDGKTVNPSDLQDGAVTVQVSTRSVKQTAPEDEFPEYDDWVNMAENTLGKFASQVLGVSEDTVKDMAKGVEGMLDGVL